MHIFVSTTTSTKVITSIANMTILAKIFFISKKKGDLASLGSR